MISATNGKTTTAKMLASLLAPERRLCRNTAGANLASGVASALLTGEGADLGVFEVDEAALPGVARRLRPRVTVLGNLFRDQLDRYGELEAIAARWQEMTAAMPAAAHLVRNGDDPLLASLGHAGPILTFGIDDAGSALARDAARERLEVVPGVRHEAPLRARLPRPSGRVELPGVRAAAAAARRLGRHGRGAGPRRHPVRAAHADRRRGRRAADAGPLQRLQRARRRRGRMCRRRRRRRPHRRRPRAVRRRLRPLRAAAGGRPRRRPPAGQEPRRGERADPHAGRGRAAQAAAPGPERPHRRRPRRLVDLGRRLRAAGRAGAGGRDRGHARRGDGDAAQVRRRRARPAGRRRRHRPGARPGARRR